jgi:hypothetical protein
VSAAEYQRARREQLKAEGRCIDCSAGLQETDGVRCVECHERNADASVQYGQTERGKSKRAQWALRRYYANHEQSKALRRLRYERRKIAGICLDCSFPAVDGAAYCLAHLEQRRLRAREAMRKKRGGA